MIRSLYLSMLFMLAACSEPVVTAQRMVEAEGNRLQITSGTGSTGRFIRVENVDKHWTGVLTGGKEKWQERATLLNSWATQEIRTICDDVFYRTVLGPTYHMMDKDDTMGGMAPVLGITAAMAAHLAASSATDDANVPVSIYSEFICRKDDL